MVEGPGGSRVNRKYFAFKIMGGDQGCAVFYQIAIALLGNNETLLKRDDSLGHQEPCFQFTRVRRFANVVVGPRTKTFNDMLRFILGGKQQKVNVIAPVEAPHPAAKVNTFPLRP